ISLILAMIGLATLKVR
ncbi:MAG: hypothetical protein AAFU82_20000, partial [Pseudomonadota bacterium]